MSESFVMPEINKTMLGGRITRYPDLSYTATGTALCKFPIAVNRRVKKDDDWKTEVLFIDVIVWGKAAEWCNANLKRTAPVYIEGRLSMSQWEDENTGQKRTKYELVAEKVERMMKEAKAEPAQDNEPEVESDIPF